MKINLIEYGFWTDKVPKNAMGIPARITAVHKDRYHLVCEYGEIYAKLKTKEYFGGDEVFPTIGDYVLVKYNPCGDSWIVSTLPRKTFFTRKDPTPGRGEQAVAANFDYVFIVQSLNQDFNTRRLERYLTLAWQSGALPIVILTKADLLEDYEEYISQVEKIAAGVKVHAVSSKTGLGMETLADYMTCGKTVVFLGSSGVGKSSLVNALAGEEIMSVNGIREDDSKGRHTTTHRQLIKIKNGAMIIDTPGMRELGMWDVTIGLGEAFADVEQFLGKCRFGNCKHQTEPGCAIKEAIDNGELSEERWKSYLKLGKEAKFTERKEMIRNRNRNVVKYRRDKKGIIDKIS